MTASKNLLSASASGGAKLYVEDVFSTWLYTGNSSTQTITNGIDLAGEGGLVWIKGRSGATIHQVFDTLRGATYELTTVTSGGQVADADTLTAFNSDGFSLGADAATNTSSATYASWTFRKAEKFFDVVTYTGNGANRTIAHNLGSVPGCIIVKRVDTTGVWRVYHNGLTSAAYFVSLNSTLGEGLGASLWNSTAPTSSVFSLGIGDTNTSGGTYVAYLFAHNAGGFGLTGTDNVISCGSFYAVQSGSNVTVNLGFEPQFVLLKNIDTSDDWRLYDSMRGMQVNPGNAMLRPNSTAAEYSNSSPQCYVTSTGFVWAASTGLGYTGNQIYIAIRRGPMKVPTDATKVFSPNADASAVGTRVTTNFPVDLYIGGLYRLGVHNTIVQDRLRGFSAGNTNPQTGVSLRTDTTGAEYNTGFPSAYAFDNTSFLKGSDPGAVSVIWWNFRRAPGFFDVVAYTGTGSAHTENHNLGVAPELMIVKERSASDSWNTYCNYLSSSATRYLQLNTTIASTANTSLWGSTDPTASVFTVGSSNNTNQSGQTYIAYLFASLPGVSKVGSYTGNGSSQTIDCGFSAGARFVLIKRTDSTGDWYVWDTARGIVSANDPHLSLNTAAAEVTTDDSVDPDASGFIVNQNATTNINVSSASYIYLAIA